jgi:hypothetical protein
MTIAGENIVTVEDLEIAADVLADVEEVRCWECNGKRSVTDYSPDRGWINIECPCCQGTGTMIAAEPDGDDWEPEPPTPAAPGLALVPRTASNVTPIRCQNCGDTQRVLKPSAFFPGKIVEGFCEECVPHYDFQTRRFVRPLAIAETGEETPPTAPAAVPLDRAAHCRRIASFGGTATVSVHGTHHMRVIGQTGARVTIDRYGFDYWRGLVTAKGWTAPRRASFLDDLRAGRELAALAA